MLGMVVATVNNVTPWCNKINIRIYIHKEHVNPKNSNTKLRCNFNNYFDILSFSVIFSQPEYYDP